MINKRIRARHLPLCLRLLQRLECFATHSFAKAANALNPAIHNVAARASEDTSEKAPILDTGATNTYSAWIGSPRMTSRMPERIYLGEPMEQNLERSYSTTSCMQPQQANL